MALGQLKSSSGVVVLSDDREGPDDVDHLGALH